MARVKLNSIVKGLSGSIGNLVIKQYNGKTIVAGKANKTKKQSELQRQSRLRFKQAAYWAKTILRDPQKKAYYTRKAKKNNQPNAYTAALQDFLKNMVPAEKTVLHANKRNGVVTSGEKVMVKQALIEVRTSEGTLVEKGRVKVNRKVAGEFTISLKKAHLQNVPLTIRVLVEENS